LLLNHLMIDGEGRIVFDSSDDSVETTDATSAARREAEQKDEEDDGEDEHAEASALETSRIQEPAAEVDPDVEIDVAALGAVYFPDLARLDELDVCPSLKTFDLGDPSGSLDIPFLRAPEDWRQDQEEAKQDGAEGHADQSGLFIDEDNPLGFEDDGVGAFDMGGDVQFGEGGEAWARQAALEPQMHVYDADQADGEHGDAAEMLGDQNGDFIVSMAHTQKAAHNAHDDILGYFDQALQRNWSSAEHWRIRKIKDVNKPAAPTRQRKEKEPFEIDFSAPLDASLAEVLYTPASSNSAISLPKKDWKSKSRNLLPDDKHFSSKQLLNLFLKPKARLSRRRQLGYGARRFGGFSVDEPANEVPEGELDEAFWASQKAPNNHDHGGEDTTALPQGDYDANFFQDDGLPFAGAGMEEEDDIDEFADAREHFSPGLGGDGLNGMDTVGMTGGISGFTMTNPADLAFGTMLVTQSRRVRPEYVQYARVAKKVDVRRLKEEIWKGMALDKLDAVGILRSLFLWHT
jgi:condensin complex subunit 2